jgi:hypothetical protein
MRFRKESLPCDQTTSQVAVSRAEPVTTRIVPYLE